MNRNFDESKHIKALRDLLDRRQQEQAALRDKVRELQDQKAADEKTKQEALTNGNNDAYLEAHQRIQNYEIQLNALQDLLAAKEKISNKPDIISALHKAIADYEKDRKKELEKYKAAKAALAKAFTEIAHDEAALEKIRDYFMSVGNIGNSLDVNHVQKFENYDQATRFLRSELESFGYDVTAILSGKDGF